MGVESDENRAALGHATSLIERRLHPAALLLFGSVASGSMRQDSDVDLAALLGGPCPDAFALRSLVTDLEALVGREVDLVVLDTASPVLAMEVLRQHRVLVNHTPELLENFIVKTLGAYFDLKRVRRPIEDALLQRSMRE